MANSPSGLNQMAPHFKTMVDILRDTMRHDFGKNGSVYINDNTNNHDGPFYAIQGISSAELDFTTGGTSQTLVDGSMIGYDADFVIPNGAIIYGHFTRVRLKTAGACIAYKK
tara:strand:- start:258 stop:593 length:336 start_codon:yes stop_codon:yes gene_type:complete